MPGITLDLADAAELAETLALITEWLSGDPFLRGLHGDGRNDAFGAPVYA